MSKKWRKTLKIIIIWSMHEFKRIYQNVLSIRYGTTYVLTSAVALL